jgi:hypothetical protein
MFAELLVFLEAPTDGRILVFALSVLTTVGSVSPSSLIDDGLKLASTVVSLVGMESRLLFRYVFRRDEGLDVGVAIVVIVAIVEMSSSEAEDGISPATVPLGFSTTVVGYPSMFRGFARRLSERAELKSDTTASFTIRACVVRRGEFTALRYFGLKVLQWPHQSA